MAASLHEDARKKANLRLLQRSIDASIEDIVGSATHVVLYEYIAPQGWEKSQVEGSVFLVQKPGPSYSLAILNRNSTDNFQVQVTQTFQLQHKEPYLIFKQSPKILGIWFHNTNERVVMASLLNQVIYNLQQAAANSNIAVPTPPQQRLPPQLFQQQQQLPPQQAAVGTTSVPLQPNGSSRPAAASPMAQYQQQMHTPASSTSRSNQAAVASPSQLMEPLFNALFISPADAGGASTPQQQQQQAPQPPPPPPDTPTQQRSTSSGSATPTSIPGVALDKKSLQLALLSLIQDDRFVDLLHAQYLKVAHARASRNSKK